MRLPLGGKFIAAINSKSATEVYITNANIDWGSDALFASFASRESDFLDIGSHIGYYSCYLAPAVRRVYAFEPDPRNLVNIQRNAALADNIQIVQKAVSSVEGTANFYASYDSSVGSLESVGGPSTQVSVTTVDSFTAAHPELKPTLVKIDVEGHDIEVLRGMEQTIANFQPLILAEADFEPNLAGLCSKWRYQVFAFARDRKTQKLRFQKVTEQNSGDFYKMLFLVPPRLLPSFTKLV